VAEGASPTVTCIIPTFNSRRFLADAIDSVLGQSPPPVEVLVVDQNSTDGTRELVTSYGPPVHLITRPGRGPAPARQHGTSLARGEFVCFLDADDLFMPGKQERQLERFEVRPELEISLCGFELFWEAGLEHERERYRAAGRDRGTSLIQTMLARRSVFEKVGPIDPAWVYVDNIDWLARARDAGAVIEVLNEVVVRRRMHAGSLLHQSPSLDPYVDVVKARLDRVRAASRR
jgi:glycosyltransferase involved in cell wall biosynthesis